MTTEAARLALAQDRRDRDLDAEETALVEDLWDTYVHGNDRRSWAEPYDPFEED